MEALENLVNSNKSVELPSLANIFGLYTPARDTGRVYAPAQNSKKISEPETNQKNMYAPSYSIKGGMLCIDPFGTVRDNWGNIIVQGIGHPNIDARFRYDGELDKSGNYHINHELYYHNSENGRDQIISNDHIPISQQPNVMSTYSTFEFAKKAFDYWKNNPDNK